jgi:hypothetical protein
LCTKIGWLKSGIHGVANNKGFHGQLHLPTEITWRCAVVGSDYWSNEKKTSERRICRKCKLGGVVQVLLFHDNYKQCHDFEIALLILTFNIIIIHLSLGFSSFVCFVQFAVSVA